MRENSMFDGDRKSQNSAAWKRPYCGQTTPRERLAHNGSSFEMKCKLRSYLIEGVCPAYLEDIGGRFASNGALDSIVRDRTNFPAYWRARAEEVRIIAEDFVQEETRERMMRIAAGYEVMAAHLDPKPEAP
jgi:hypothetical protein